MAGLPTPNFYAIATFHSLHNDSNVSLYLVVKMFGFIMLGICCLLLCKAEYVHENIHRLEGTVHLLRIDFFITDRIFPKA